MSLTSHLSTGDVGKYRAVGQTKDPDTINLVTTEIYMKKIPRVDVSVGIDYEELYVTGLEECNISCKTDESCLAYNYIDRKCWKKEVITTFNDCPIESCVSGIKIFPSR